MIPQAAKGKQVGKDFMKVRFRQHLQQGTSTTPTRPTAASQAVHKVPKTIEQLRDEQRKEMKRRGIPCLSEDPDMLPSEFEKTNAPARPVKCRQTTFVFKWKRPDSSPLMATTSLNSTSTISPVTTSVKPGKKAAESSKSLNSTKSKGRDSDKPEPRRMRKKKDDTKPDPRPTNSKEKIEESQRLVFKPDATSEKSQKRALKADKPLEESGKSMKVKNDVPTDLESSKSKPETDESRSERKPITTDKPPPPVKGSKEKVSQESRRDQPKEAKAVIQAQPKMDGVKPKGSKEKVPEESRMEQPIGSKEVIQEQTRMEEPKPKGSKEKAYQESRRDQPKGSKEKSNGSEEDQKPGETAIEVGPTGAKKSEPEKPSVEKRKSRKKHKRKPLDPDRVIVEDQEERNCKDKAFEKLDEVVLSPVSPCPAELLIQDQDKLAKAVKEFEDDVTPNTAATAVIILKNAHEKKAFEKLMTESENQILAKFFAGMLPYNDKLITFINKTLDMIFEDAQQSHKKSPLNLPDVHFFLNREMAKKAIFDALFSHPEYLAESWKTKFQRWREEAMREHYGINWWTVLFSYPKQRSFDDSEVRADGTFTPKARGLLMGILFGPSDRRTFEETTREEACKGIYFTPIFANASIGCKKNTSGSKT